MLALAIGSIDYGYPWWLSYGHLPILIAGLAIGFLGYARKWSRASSHGDPEKQSSNRVILLQQLELPKKPNGEIRQIQGRNSSSDIGGT